eukprot:s149_g16.t1
MAPLVPGQFQPILPGHVTFQASVRGMQQDEVLCLIGEPEELGAWKEAKAVMMSSNDRFSWSVQLQVAPKRTIRYKYLRKDKDGQWVQWEDGPNSQNREFCWDGSSVAHDDGEIHGFGARAFQLPAKASVTTGHGGNSVKAKVGWRSTEEVPKHEWICEKFDQMEDRMGRYEKNISDLFRRLEDSETFLKHHRRILLTLENKLDDVEERLGNGNFLQLIEQGLQDSKFSQKHLELEQDVASLQQRMRHFSALIAANDLRFHKFQDVMDSHAKSLAGLQLSCFPKDSRPTASAEQMGSMGSELKELESQVTATAMTAMSQQKSSGDRTSKPPVLASVPSKSTKDAAQVDSIPSAPSKAAQNKALKEWDERCGKEEAVRRRSISMPKSLASRVRARSPFVGFQIPKKPLDEAMRKLCLEVEEELHQAVSQDFPAETREKLLKRLWVKVHPDKLLDKTGKRREAFNWFEEWKGIHIIWYYRPHPVPEADRKYLPQEGNWRSLNS